MNTVCFNKRLKPVILRCIEKRKIINLLGNNGECIKNVVPINFENGLLIMVKEIKFFHMSYENIKEIEVTGEFPARKILFERRKSKGLPILVEYAGIIYTGILIDYSKEGLGIRLTAGENFNPQLKNEIKIKIKDYSSEFSGKIVYYNKNLSRLGLKLNFIHGQNVYTYVQLMEKFSVE